VERLTLPPPHPKIDSDQSTRQPRGDHYRHEFMWKELGFWAFQGQWKIRCIPHRYSGCQQLILH
jgi:hypothetical protein